MGFRFRKSVKIGPGVRLNFSTKGVSATLGGKGFTTSIGKSGVYQNICVPGTGLSYRTKISEGASAGRKSSGRVSRSTSSGSSISKAVQEWRAYTGKANPGVELYLDERGEIGFLDETGAVVTDPNLLAIIKRTPRYKDQLPLIKERQRKAVANMVELSQKKSLSFTRLYTRSPQVRDRGFYEANLKELRPECYIPAPYDVPAPTPEAIQFQLSREADENVTGAPWKLRKLKEQYFNERYQLRFNEAMLAWQAVKDAFDKSEIAKAAQLNAGYIEEYDQMRSFFERALQGDPDYIEEAAEQWMLEIDVPVDISTQFEYRPENRSLMVDLDLPEIEHLPTEETTQMANGRMKVKDKTQKALRAEYAQCVFGVMVFVAANLFNVSPVIETMVVSGYTQRRDKVGDLVDEYIASVKFTRKGFCEVDCSSIDPEMFCMRFENRCKLTTTKAFKEIEPYA